jgi:hypothetical protein
MELPARRLAGAVEALLLETATAFGVQVEVGL